MTSIGLFFAGSVLFINGLSLLGRCDAASAAPINAFVGTLLLAIVASTALHVKNPAAPENQQAILGAVGFLLFAFTYLWVAINNWTGASGTGLGWYCLWAASASVFLAVVNFTSYHDPRFGMLWVLWAVLFTLFFLVLGLEVKELERVTGWATTIEAFVTTAIPGALLLLGDWRAVSGVVAVAAGLITIVLVALLGATSLARSHGHPSPPCSASPTCTGPSACSRSQPECCCWTSPCRAARSQTSRGSSRSAARYAPG